MKFSTNKDFYVKKSGLQNELALPATLAAH
jgi:hypothetical protein